MFDVIPRLFYILSLLWNISFFYPLFQCSRLKSIFFNVAPNLLYSKMPNFQDCNFLKLEMFETWD